MSSCFLLEITPTSTPTPSTTTKKLQAAAAGKPVNFAHKKLGVIFVRETWLQCKGDVVKELPGKCSGHLKH